jgi:hypothetical protein
MDTVEWRWAGWRVLGITTMLFLLRNERKVDVVNLQNSTFATDQREFSKAKLLKPTLNQRFAKELQPTETVHGSTKSTELASTFENKIIGRVILLTHPC